jgi:hypothetical protein
VVTALREMATFYPAEDYHQGYPFSSDLILTRFGPLTKAAAYKRYRDACGRDARVQRSLGRGGTLRQRRERQLRDHATRRGHGQGWTVSQHPDNRNRGQ